MFLKMSLAASVPREASKRQKVLDGQECERAKTMAYDEVSIGR